MAVHSSRTKVRFTPPGHEGDEAPPVYIIQGLDLRLRAAWFSKLTEWGARMVTDDDLIAAVRESVDAIDPPPDNIAEIHALLDEFSIARQDNASISGDLRAKYSIVEQLAQHQSRKVAGLMAARQMYAQIAPPLAAQLGIRGLENVYSRITGEPVRFATDENGVLRDVLLEELDIIELQAVGARVLEMTFVSPVTAKNSASPQLSPEDPATSALH